MGKKIKSTLVLLFTPLALLAQEDSSEVWLLSDTIYPNPILLQQYTSDNAYVTAFGEGAINSNGLIADFYVPFKKGGFIDVNLKDRAYDALGDNNRLGGDLDFGLTWQNSIDSLFGSADWSYFVTIADRLHFDASFTNDLFRAIFYGNRDFAGETAELAEFSMNVLRYQQFKVGLIKAKNNYLFGGAVSFIKGENYLNIDASRADFFTEEQGLYLDLDLNMEINRSDTAGENGLGAFNGWGAAIDLYVHRTSDIGSFILELNDMGAIQWNDKAQQFKTDSTYHWEGLEVSSLLDAADSVYFNNKVDSLRAAYEFQYTNKSITSYLPGYIHLGYGTSLPGGHYTLRTGVKYRVMANYFPYLYVNGSWKAAKAFGVSLNLAYGGYGNIQMGLGARTVIKQRLFLNLYSNNLEGFIGPSSFGGQSLGASITFQINNDSKRKKYSTLE